MIIPSMARTRRYMHGKKRRSPLRHDHFDREFSDEGKRFIAAQERHEKDVSSGRIVTQPISSYIQNVQNDLNALARTGKSDTPKFKQLQATLARLEGMQSNE